jgi:hypothetical protein
MPGTANVLPCAVVVNLRTNRSATVHINEQDLRPTRMVFMTSSFGSDLVNALRILVPGILIAVGPCSVLATESSNDENLIQIVLTKKLIRVGDSELCSLASLESLLTALPRSRPVSVEAVAETQTDVLLGIREILTTLGFEQFTLDVWGDEGWGLYPPSPDVEFHGCDQHE